MKSLLLIALFSTALAAPSVTFVLGCGRYPGPCNNKCYSTYVAGKSATARYGKYSKTQKDAQRVASGARTGVCCGNNPTIAPPPFCYDVNGNRVACEQADEYPYASTKEGGAGATLRCTGADENETEGRDLGTMISTRVDDGGCGSTEDCLITIAFSFVDDRAPFCMTKQGPNDGFEWTYVGGQYAPARRDDDLLDEGSTQQSPTWKSYEPDPADFFPPHLRREFLLDNGVRVVVGSRDMEKSYEDEVFWMGNSTARMVRELKGMEKSVPFQPPMH